jgi:tRNA A-37 threonylcarbamoyl transferase component Bud32
MSLLKHSISLSDANIDHICDEIIQQIQQINSADNVIMQCSGIFIHNAFPFVDEVKILYPQVIPMNTIKSSNPQKISYLAVYNKIESEGAFRLLTFYSRKAWNLLGYSISGEDGLEFTRYMINYTLGGYIVPSYAIYGLFIQEGTHLVDLLLKIEQSMDHFYRYRRELVRKGLVDYSFKIEDLFNIPKDFYRRLSVEMRMLALKEMSNELYTALESSVPRNKVDMKNFEFLRMEKDNPPKIAFFVADKYQNRGSCENLTIKKYISSGAYGSVSQICCQNDCGYIMKIISGVKNNVNEFHIVVEQEIEGWKHASSIGLAPTLVEYYLSNTDSARYCIFISEMMDKTADEILAIINNDGREELRYRFFKALLERIQLLHESGYFHGDCHLKNIMVKTDDKTIYDDIERTINGIEGGTVQLKFIDFGLSGSIEEINRNPKKMGFLLRIMSERLLKLACVDRNINIVGNETFGDIMKFYDVTLIGYGLLRSANISPEEPSKKLIIDKQKSYNTYCTPGIAF